MRHYTREEWSQVFENLLGDPLPGQTAQGVMEESLSQRHYFGARLAIPRVGSVYRYVRADADRQLRAAYAVWSDIDYVETGTVPVLSVVGSRTVTCLAVAAVVADEFAEGIISFSAGGTSLYGENYRIKGNTAAALGANFTVTLYDALVHALTVADVATLFHSPWHSRVICQRQRSIDGVATDLRKTSWTGVPNRFVQASYYCWVQTWGPCMVIPAGGTEGVADDERMMHFEEDGSVAHVDYATPHEQQIAGFVLPFTTAGAIPNLLEIFLQISP